MKIIKVGGKSVIMAAELTAALERRSKPETGEHQPDGDELAAMRARIARVG